MRDVTCFKYENGKRVNVQIDETVAAEAYKEFVSKNIREFSLRVKFNGSKELTSSDIASIRINSDLFTTDSFTIGSVVAETLELTIYMDTVFGTDDFGYVDGYVVDKEKPIVPYIALRTEVEVETPYGFELQEIWQEVNLGPFFINPDGINEDGIGIMSIRASTLFTHPTYSNKSLGMVSKIDRDLYKMIDLSYDAIKNDKVYFTLLNTDLPDITAKYDNIADMSVREAINYIAILYGGYARTIYKDDRVYLEFFRKQQTDYVYDESDYIHLSRGGSGSGLRVSKIKCKTTDKQSILVGSGTDTNNTVYIECADMTQEQLYAILTEFVGYNFRPTTTKIFGNPMLQVGDITTIRGRGINSGGDELPLHSVIYNITGSGVTMDIKSLFKVVEAEKKAKDEEDDDDNEQSFQERVDADLKELYDRTTIQEEDKDKNIPLITIKQDYLDTKETLEDHIKNHPGGPEDTLTSKGCIYMSPYDTSKILGHIKPIAWPPSEDDDKRAHLQIASQPGYDLSFGFRNPRYQDGDPNAYEYYLTISDSTYKLHNGTYFHRGINIYEPYVYGKLNITTTSKASGSDAFGTLFTDSFNNQALGRNVEVLKVHGKDALYLGFDDKDCMCIGYDQYGTGKVVRLMVPLVDSNYNAVASVTNEMSAQSEYTELLAECGTDENKTHINMSYDSNELRWCWKETVFTYAESDIDPETDQWVYTGRYICYIELPIFMAENIENDYHINVSKMSWGDYRIIEKTPYYFILESQEDNFAFTFEVVAKLTDNDNQ